VFYSGTVTITAADNSAFSLDQLDFAPMFTGLHFGISVNTGALTIPVTSDSFVTEQASLTDITSLTFESTGSFALDNIVL
jgi:hypothetical protein